MIKFRMSSNKACGNCKIKYNPTELSGPQQLCKVIYHFCPFSSPLCPILINSSFIWPNQECFGILHFEITIEHPPLPLGLQEISTPSHMHILLHWLLCHQVSTIIACFFRSTEHSSVSKNNLVFLSLTKTRFSSTTTLIKPSCKKCSEHYTKYGDVSLQKLYHFCTVTQCITWTLKSSLNSIM